MNYKEKLRQILKQYWGYDNFRPLQEDIMSAVIAREDVLAVLPTGGGKSLCFQIPAIALEGTCLVISPLIALMRDQVEQLRKRNVPAAGLFSGLHPSETETILENLVNKAYKLLYISPERLQSANFQSYLRNADISFLAVDEAHCISQWGYDFRPSYLKISTIREFFPDLPIIALTASATPLVQRDIQDKLRMKNRNIFHASFLRSNLSFSAFESENKGQKVLEILKAVPGSSVLYVQSRKNAAHWAAWLTQNGLVADYYHAGLSPKDRERKQKFWIQGKTPILVATNAFGMGIDKGDVRTVVHMEIPNQPEAYYQEAGRAGRDGVRAYAVALFTRQELKDAIKKIEAHFPTVERIRQVYEQLGIYLRLAIGSGELVAFDFDLERFCSAFNLHPGSTYQALKKLEIAGYLLFNEGFDQPSRFHFSVSSATLYAAQVRQKPVEEITKALLRLYGGQLFSDFVEIKEGELAVLLKTNHEAIQQRLQKLNDMELGRYQPQRTGPQVTFLKPRLDAQNLELDKELIQRLKQNELDRLATMQQYLLLEKDCRSAFLATYFGEITPVDCGICDNCLKRKKKDLPLGFAFFKPLIMKAAKESLTPKELEKQFRPQQKVELRDCLRILLEEEVIFLNEEGKLQVPKPRKR